MWQIIILSFSRNQMHSVDFCASRILNMEKYRFQREESYLSKQISLFSSLTISFIPLSFVSPFVQFNYEKHFTWRCSTDGWWDYEDHRGGGVCNRKGQLVNWTTQSRQQFTKFFLPPPLYPHVIIGNIGYIGKRKARKRDDNERRETKFAVERGNYKELGEAGEREREKRRKLKKPWQRFSKGKLAEIALATSVPRW